MNQYPFENLNDEEFENLVIRISNELFGIGCKHFSVGPDGAKDGWFEGTAFKYPSEAVRWKGTFILQAKHTLKLNASCSNNDFQSETSQSSVLSKEIKRLLEIQKTEPFDNYIIFTNRKLPGTIHTPLITRLRKALGIQNVEIVGREELNGYLNNYPHIADKFGLYQFASPLRFYEKDLREIIIFFSETRSSIATAASDYLKNYDVINKEQKNIINYLSQEYFEFIKTHSLHYFENIEFFLQDPKNEIYTKYYSNTVSDLQAKIILERNRFSDFMLLIEHLVDYTVAKNEDRLKDLRELVRVFIHFMYFNCDIGKTK